MLLRNNFPSDAGNFGILLFFAMHPDVVISMKSYSRHARAFPIFATLCATFLFSGCESQAEKAERHFQSAKALLSEGDEARAQIEFLNVFKYAEFHKDALEAYAALMLKQGRTQEAYGQYLRLVDRYPGTLEARVALAEIAVRNGDWSEAEKHGAAALDLAPDDPQAKAVDLVLQYGEALRARDPDARERIAAQAEDMLEISRDAVRADTGPLPRIVIDNLIAQDDPTAALPVIDAVLEREPAAMDLNMLKVRILSQAGEIDAAGAQLREMLTRFPDNRDVQQALIDWHLSQEDVDGAEAFLRARAGADTADPGGHLSVVQLLEATRGAEAARSELARLKEANADTENVRLYTALLAMADFEAGQTEAGLTAMHAALDGAEPGAQTRAFQVNLAKMRLRSGDQDGARALVDAILAEDPANVPSLKLRADWLIDEDRPGAALADLRKALNQDPRDPETLTLMALAHQRDGATELMGERLTMAHDASNSAPAESLRYARFLLDQGMDRMAIDVLEKARQRAPRDLDMLLLLADVHLDRKSWPDAQVIVDALREIDSEDARQAALTVQATILQAQNRNEDSLALLAAEVGDNSSQQDHQATRSVMLIVQTHVADGAPEEARAYLDEILQTSPDNPDLQLLDADLNARVGRTDAAESGYRDLITRFPQNERPVRSLMELLSESGRTDDMRAVLAEALSRMPGSVLLLGLDAGLLERDGDIDGAIAIYETLYARDSGNIVLANNLASLLSVRRDDPDSVERAYTIAKRLRDTRVAVFQDTYGWIEHLRGNSETALAYLVPAAAALESDPIVQYHLGMVYARLGRDGEARAALDRALGLADPSQAPRLEEARETLAALSAASPDSPPR